MTAVKTEQGAQPAPQSAAAPSPFPPIADYAFLSDCHTGALVAPDGAIDWLCIPSFDSPSVFGSLLDRQAGFFRFGPFGIAHPTARAYVPGTNVFETTWKTPTGWAVVRDALSLGERIVLWSVDPGDWQKGATAKQIKRAVLGAVRPGSIVILHDGGGDRTATIAALPGIIKGIRHKGLRLVAIPEH